MYGGDVPLWWQRRSHVFTSSAVRWPQEKPESSTDTKPSSQPQRRNTQLEVVSRFRIKFSDSTTSNSFFYISVQLKATRPKTTIPEVWLSFCLCFYLDVNEMEPAVALSRRCSTTVRLHCRHFYCETWRCLRWSQMYPSCRLVQQRLYLTSVSRHVYDTV